MKLVHEISSPVFQEKPFDLKGSNKQLILSYLEYCSSVLEEVPSFEQIS